MAKEEGAEEPDPEMDGEALVDLSKVASPLHMMK